MKPSKKAMKVMRETPAMEAAETPAEEAAESPEVEAAEHEPPVTKKKKNPFIRANTIGNWK